MTGEALVRPGRSEDVVVLRLWREAESVPGATDDPAALRTLLGRDSEGLLIAELDGRLVGCLIAVFDGWRGNMYRLAVHPAHRRLRLGSQLIEAGERRLRGQGARRITALVLASDARAASVWRSAGYAHDERIGRYVKNVA